MKRGSADRYLGWAFALALAAHAAAVAAGGKLSPTPGENGYLDKIRVFNAEAPMVVSRVDLVDWQDEQSPAPEEALDDGGDITLAPASRVERPEPERPVVRSGRRDPPTVKHPRLAPGGEPERAPQPTRVSDPTTPPGGGGGGGGPADMGSGSSGGDANLPVGGGTPVGQVVGTGTGSGPGTGAGSGGGRGGGTGGGEGSGVGFGSGPGVSDAGNGGGKAPDGGSGGFVSRVADRAAPEVVSKGRLEYPASAVADGVEGRVRLKVLVTEEGTVADVQVVSSSGDRRLDAAAREFVSKWRYRPAVQDGTPRRVHSMATVAFDLR
jgi:TonB family protein